MAASLTLVGGDEIVEPFVLKRTDGAILDLSLVNISGGVWWRRRLQIELAVDDGIEIEDEHPPLAAVGEDQIPHGNIRIIEDRSILIPLGLIANLRLVAVTKADAVTMSTYFVPIKRIR